MNEMKIKRLACQIVKLSYDYDTYEFRDTFADEEEALSHVEAMLMDDEQIKSLIALCDDILESENKEFYEDAKRVKEKIFQIKKERKQ